MLVNCLSGVALRPWLKDLVRKMTEKDRARIKKHKKETKKPMVIKRINKKGKSVCILSEFGSLISAPVSCAILTVFGLVAIFTRRDMRIGNQMRSHTFDVI